MSYESKFIIFLILTTTFTSSSSSSQSPPTPKPWPHQFHSRLIMTNKNGAYQINDLWYDYTNGRNFNIIQNQLGKLLYDLEWNNGTSFYYTLNSTAASPYGDGCECKVLTFPVGILTPDWLHGATYLGERNVDGFLCNVWEKVDFITYFEDVVTKRPVSWVFYTGMVAHVMTFEIGAVLEDAGWQAPPYCFTEASKEKTPLLESMASLHSSRRSLMKSFGDAQSQL